MSLLHVTVAEPVATSLRWAQGVMEALDRGDAVTPWNGISFDEMPQMLALFTASRWALITALRSAGPQTVAQIARRLERSEDSVRDDLSALIDWHVIERAQDGHVLVPWSQIVVDLRLPERWLPENH